MYRRKDELPECKAPLYPAVFGLVLTVVLLIADALKALGVLR